MISSHSAGSISRNGPTWVSPALLTRPSTRPNRSIDLLDQPFRLAAVRDVRREAVTLRPGRADAFEGPLGGIRRPVVMDRDDRAFGGGLHRDLRADAAAAAGDEDDAVGERRASRADDLGTCLASRAPSGAPAAGAPVEPRIASSVGSTARASSSPPRTRAASTNPRLPISRSGSRTVERLGDVIAATGTSSKPATDTSPGTSIPSPARRCSAPSARRSFAQQIAVNGAGPESSVSTPSAPPSGSKLVWMTTRSSNGIPAVGETSAVARETGSRDEQRGGAGEERDLAMPERDERIDHARHAGLVVDADIGLTERMRREVDHGSTVDAHRSQVLVQLLGALRVVEPARGEDDPGGTHRAQQPDVRALALRVALGAAGDDQVTGG